jgi:hypothetical protein
MDDKFKQLIKEKFITSLPSTTMSTPIIHANVPMLEIRSQSGLVTHPTLINQNLGW